VRRCSFLLVVAAFCSAQSPEPIDVTKSDPIAYLNRALDEMQASALRRETVDWPSVRAKALASAAHAEITVDTYDAIRVALANLGDHHSSLHLTLTLENLESRRKSLAPSIEKPQTQIVAPSPFVGRYEPEGRLEHFEGKTFALVVVPKCFPENEHEFVAYETKLQGIIADLDRSQPSGWIVDLRGNVGGNMWPMLAGIGPVLGESDHLGESLTTKGNFLWKYRDGVASNAANGKTDPYPAVESVPYKLKGTPAVAVLLDRRTGSSGEAIAIAFRGRPLTRFFGQHTQGVSTGNETFALSDGASLWLTVGVQADRTGKQYIDGLDPDVLTRPTDTIVSDDQDPTLQAAFRWLLLQQ